MSQISSFKPNPPLCPICPDLAFCQYLKVATAVAVIRTKPPDCTAKQHAENLQREYQGSLEMWRSRAEKLQQEVLLLKQDLVLQEYHEQEERMENQSEGC